MSARLAIVSMTDRVIAFHPQLTVSDFDVRRSAVVADISLLASLVTIIDEVS